LTSSSESSESSASSSSSGGVCASLWNIFSELCVVLHDLGRSPWQVPLPNSSSSGGGGGTASECSFAIFQAASAYCNAKFPEIPAASAVGAAMDDDDRTAAASSSSVGIDSFGDQTVPGAASSTSFSIPESELGAVHAILESLGTRIDKAVDAALGGAEINDANFGSTSGNEGNAAAASGWVNAPLAEGASHPMIVTSTGGIAQDGQVATALVLKAASASAVERGLKCALAELYHRLRDLYAASYTRALARTAATTTEGGAAAAESLPKPVPLRRPVCNSPSSLLTHRGGDDGGGFAGGALHAAYEALSGATATMVTCQGSACQTDGEDYAELMAALRHALKVTE
jgi:hypothetical protein